MEAHTVAEVRTVRTVVVAPTAEARVVEARTVAAAARVAEAVDVGDWSFWLLAILNPK